MSPCPTPCRITGITDLESLLSLGETPLADVLLTDAELAESNPLFPLNLAFSPSSSLVQLVETVPRELLFNDRYPYYSAVSSTLLKHFQESAEALIQTQALGPSSLVMEAASNDGCFLKHFVRNNIRVVGIDPSAGPAHVARGIGVRTVLDFFTRDLADELVAEHGPADVFIANNVLAHVANPNDFVAGMARVLRDDGVAVIEVPYVVDLVEHCEFDTIYHQHLCYFSLSSLKHLIEPHGLTVASVKRIPIHGGSLRLEVRHGTTCEPSVSKLLRFERDHSVDTIDYYRNFASRVAETTQALKSRLCALKKGGARLAGFGAAAKANTLLAYAGIDGQLLDFVVDSNPAKHGLHMGNGLKIVDERFLRANRTDYLLVLAWNFADEIMSQLNWYREDGGQFILPIPHPSSVPRQSTPPQPGAVT